jgi:TatD DNase family protein
MPADAPPLWIDSHAHLTMFEEGELAAALQRAAARGVGGVLVPATSPADLDRTTGLAAAWPGRLLAAVGVHPHDASTLDSAGKARLERALAEPGVVAVGEIGLDYHYLRSPREDQLRALDWQLELAIAAGLPVVLHNRESWPDLESRLARHRGILRGVCHSFTEGPAEAMRVVELGLLVGVSGMVTFKAAHNIREMAAALAPSRVLVETDSPFLAPVPHRGRRNEPSYVVHVGEALAELWGVSGSEVAAASTRSFRELFSVAQQWPQARLD